MTVEGVDFSYGRPSPAALVKAGKRFVIRYVPYPGDGGKGLTAKEVTAYRSAGLALALVFESSRGRAKQGRAAGAADAKQCLTSFANLKLPVLPVYFAVDFDATADDQPAIDAYLRGAASVLGAARVGVYGEYSVLNRCYRNETARWYWQTYAWSGGTVAAFAHLYQYRNGQIIDGEKVDYDRALRADYGQWAPPPPDTSTAGADVDLSTLNVFTSPKAIRVPKGVALYQTLDFSDTPDIVSPGRDMPVAGQFGTGSYLVGYTPDDGSTPGRVTWRIVRNRDVDAPFDACPACPPSDCTQAIADAVAPVQKALDAANLTISTFRGALRVIASEAAQAADG